MAESLPSPLRLLVRQVGYQNRKFRRVPVAAFFTLAFPLIFLLLFGTIYGDGEIFARGHLMKFTQFYAPGLAVFTAVSATYTNIGISTAIDRDEGILRRVRSTPLPRWVYLGGVVTSGVSIALVGALIMLFVGIGLYGVEVNVGGLPAAATTFLVGTGSFAMLGLALAALAPSGQSSPALANATILPVAFVSDVFIPIGDAPGWLRFIGNVLPLKPFVEAFSNAFDPFQAGSMWDLTLLVRIGAWGMFGALVAAWRFRWDPSVGSAGRRRRGPLVRRSQSIS
jgi:ABC-2 type transport system permease protein